MSATRSRPAPYSGSLRDRNTILREAVRERTGEFDTARESLSILAAIADFHDDDTDQHAKRVGSAQR